MPQTVSVQIRPGITAFFQSKTGSNPDDSNVGVIPAHYIPELDATNTVLNSIDSKTPPLITGSAPVIIIQPSNGIFTSRNGSTSATINTLTQLFSAQTTRTEWFILNLSEVSTIELWFGSSGNEVLVDVLDPGEKKYRSKITTGFNSADLGRISVKSAGGSVAYVAHEVM